MSRQPADGRSWAAGLRAVAWLAAAAWLLCVLAGCQPGGLWWGAAGTTRPAEREVTGLRMHRPESMETGWGEGLERAVFRAARNEWVECVVTPGELPASEDGGGDDGRGSASRGPSGELVWRLRPVSFEAALTGSDRADPGVAGVTGAASATEDGGSAEVQAAGWSVRAYRVVSVPADTRDVVWVRRAGPGAASQPLPRALVPLETGTRGAAGEARFVVPPGTRAVYVEWCVPVEASPGRYAGELTWRVGGAERRLPLELTVDDLTLSGSNDFAVVGEVGWDELVGAWPGVFGRVDPRLLSRLDPSHVSAVERLDQLVRLARQHRVDVSFLELAPTVKSTPREGLRLDWTEYDTVVLPWLRGEAAAETPSGRDGLGAVTVLPSSRWLRAGGGRRPAEDIAAYWRSVASHFDQQRLLSRMVLPEQVAAAELGDVGERRVRRRVEVPEGRWGWSGVRQGAWRAAAASTEAMRDGEPPRVAVVARGVLFRADAGRGVRGAGGASSRAAWFYPAERLDGVPRGTAVVPGIGLKWARRAQQDWELLELAYRRGGGGAGVPGGAAGPGGRQVVLSVLQVMVGGAVASTEAAQAPGGRPDEPGTDLLADPSDAEVWIQGMELVRRAAAWQDPTRFRGESEMQAWRMMEAAELRRWLAGVEVPRFLATSARWSQAVAGGTVRLELRLTGVEAGVQRRVVGLPEAAVEGDLVRASFPAETAWSGEGWSSAWAVSATASPPSEAVFTREVCVPVAAVRPATDAGTVRLDGSLDEWTSGEAVHRGGLVRMLDTGTAASGRLARSGKDTLVLMRWEPQGLWVGLRLSGVSHRGAAMGTNFATEAEGRAFGEDLCRLVLRSGGSEVRLLLKPAGLTVEDAPPGVASAVVPYAAVTEGVPVEGGRSEGVWRAELRVPAAMLGGPLSAGQAIEMNLIRHDRETGESSSWAGPIDRDLQPFRGVLVLRGP